MLLLMLLLGCSRERVGGETERGQRRSPDDHGHDEECEHAEGSHGGAQGQDLARRKGPQQVQFLFENHRSQERHIQAY